jgi:hypothetical protein
MKQGPREHFRWAPHTGGLAVAKPRDYEVGEELDAVSAYDAWKRCAAGEPLRPGDLLESLDENGSALHLEIYKYIGFEPAAWFVPETKGEPVSQSEVQAVETPTGQT